MSVSLVGYDQDKLKAVGVTEAPKVLPKLPEDDDDDVDVEDEEMFYAHAHALNYELELQLADRHDVEKAKNKH